VTRIAVDAMGGDHAPAPELDAVVAAVRETKALTVVLVGDVERLKPALAERGAHPGARLILKHASQVITMEDHPSAAVRSKKDSSMRVCFDLVKRREVDAVVSAGNSGAMLAASLFVLKRLPGALRPGIVTTFPTKNGSCALCDMGANVEVKPPVLAQFGVLGAVFAQVEHEKPRPRVGLLSNGEEDSKGTELTREAHAILKRLAHGGGSDFEYLGYIEGKDIFTGEVDVVATDGFTGNVVLKTTEGAAAAMLEFLQGAFKSSTRAKLGALLAKKALKEWWRKIDYAETGGAPLLGVDGVAVVCHGRSNAHALKNAIYAAARYAERDLTRRLGTALARHAAAWGPAEREATT
jgi:phosphate acyltransferase